MYIPNRDMKKIFLSLCMLMFTIGSVNAQSSMPDDQILKFVMKEQKAGSSQQQIVTKLIQKGVRRKRVYDARDCY